MEKEILEHGGLKARLWVKTTDLIQVIKGLEE